MPQLVEIEGVGTASFPDEATPKEIERALREQYPTPKRKALMEQMDAARRERTSTLAQLPSQKESEQLYGGIAKDFADSYVGQGLAGAANPFKWPEIVAQVRNTLGGPGTQELVDESNRRIGQFAADTIKPVLDVAVPFADEPTRQGVSQGLGQSAADLVTGLPDVAPLMAAGAVNPIAGVAVGAKFASDMFAGAYQKHQAAKEAKKAGDTAGYVKLNTEAIAEFLMGFGIAGGHATKEGFDAAKGKIKERAEELKFDKEFAEQSQIVADEMSTRMAQPKPVESATQQVVRKAEASGMPETARALDEVPLPPELSIFMSDKPAPELKGSMPAPPAEKPTAKVTEHPDAIVLQDLRIPEAQQGEGRGTALLQQAQELSDKTGKPLRATAHADTPEAQPRLNKWYEDNGFVQVGTDPISGKPIYQYFEEKTPERAKVEDYTEEPPTEKIAGGEEFAAKPPQPSTGEASAKPAAGRPETPGEQTPASGVVAPEATPANLTTTTVTAKEQFDSTDGPFTVDYGTRSGGNKSESFDDYDEAVAFMQKKAKQSDFATMYDNTGREYVEPTEVQKPAESPKSKKPFAEHVAELKARQKAHVDENLRLAGDSGGVEMVSTKRPGVRIIITPDIAEPGKWRTTRLDDQGPIGHTVHDSRDAAIRSYSGQWVKGPADASVGEYKVSKVETPKVAEPTPKKAPKIRRGVSAVARVNRETEMYGADIISWITETGTRILSKSGARKRKGAEWFKQNASLYDGRPERLSAPHHQIVYSDTGEYPDVVAGEAFKAGIIKGDTADDLWEALDTASRVRMESGRRAKAEEKMLDELAKQAGEAGDTPTAEVQADAFEKAKDKGDVPVEADNAQVGDVFIVDGERVEVTDVDPDGNVTLKDGKRFGTQTLESGEKIWVENVEMADRAEGDWVDDAVEPAPQPEPQPVGMGGAVPEEFAARGTPTSNKNANVDRERAKRGLDPVMKPLAKEFGPVYDSAMARIDREPEWQDTLIYDIAQNPRTLTPEENVALLQRRADLNNEYDKAARDASQAYDDGRVEDLQDAKIRLARWSEKLNELDAATEAAGTEWGRAGVFRQMMMNSDFTLASLERRMRAAKDGAPLTDSERADLVRMVDEHKKAAQDAIDKAKDAERRIAESEAARVLAELKAKEAPTVEPGIVRIAEKIVEKLDKRAEEARKRLRARIGRMSAGVDPAILVDLAEIGASHIGHIGLDFAKWSAKMIEDAGEWVHPHLEKVWDASKKLADDFVAKEAPGDTGKKVRRKITEQHTEAEKEAGIIDKITAKVEKGERGLIHNEVRKLMKQYVSQGVTEWRPMLDKVHAALRQIIPEIDPRETERIMAGVGEYRPMSKDEIVLKVGDIRRQLQKVVKIQNVVAGDPVPKFGIGRPEASSRERWYAKIYNEVVKRFGVVTDNPIAQAKGILERCKKYYDNRLIDLQHEIDTKQRIVRQKAAQPTDAELEAKISEYRRLKEERDALFPKEPLTREQQIERVQNSLDREIEKLETAKKNGWKFAEEREPITSEGIESRRARLSALREERQQARELADWYQQEQIAKELDRITKRADEVARKINEGDIAVQAKRPPKWTSAELQKAREELAALNKMRNELRNAAKPKKSPQELRLQAIKTRLAHREADLRERLASGNYAPKPKPIPVEMDAPARAAQARVKELEAKIKGKIRAEELKNRTVFEKVADKIVRWRRGFVLSGATTIGKLTAAAVARMGLTFKEEAVGGVLGRIPGFRTVSGMAPRQGGFSLAAEARAVVKAFTKGMQDSWETLRKGHGELDFLYGKGKDIAIGEMDAADRSIVDFFGHLHGALKAPVKRAEFERSLQKRTEWAIRNGVDVTDPGVQMEMAINAYKDANRAIFLQDNLITDAYKWALRRLEQPSKLTGKPTVGGKALSATARFMLPIVKVPTNIVAETFQHALGVPLGLGRLAVAKWKGFDNLKPEEADLIVRELKKGSIGGAMLLTGYFLPDSFGGYYQQNRKEGEVKFMEAQVFGVRIPKWAMHHPALMCLQLGATARKVADSKLRKKDLETQGVTSGVMAAALGLTEEVPFLREMAETSKAFNPRERGAFFGEIAKSAIPLGVQQIADYMDSLPDNYRRSPEGVWQHIEMGIPGLRENVPAKKKRVPTQ